MIDIKRLIQDFEDCIGWPYASPGSNDERGIDCSGMFVRAFRLQGESIYHGSNTIWRKHLGRKGAIQSAADLAPGMAVFKWKAQTPAKFCDGLGDFCHIGLVTAVNPLRIVHASTDGMRVKADTKIGKWKYWGVLALAEDTAQTAATSSASTQRPTLRPGSTGAAVEELQKALCALGYDLDVDGIYGSLTEYSVRDYQRRRSLKADGVAGPKTWAALGG